MWENERGRQTEPLLKHRGDDYGQPYDDTNFKGVKEEGRKCNDLLFAILFILAMVGMFSISSFAFAKGQPEKLIPSWEFAQVNITATAEQKSELWFQDAVAQLKNDRYILGGSLGLAILLGLVWIQLLKMFTKLFIYLTLILGVLVILALGVYTFTVGAQKHNSSIKIVAYCIFALAGLVILAMIFLRKRIALTCALFKECCAGVQWNPSVFLIGGIVIAVFSAFTVFWVASFIYLYSVPAQEKYHVPYAPPKFDQSVRHLMYYQVFGYFWVTSFISAVFQMSIAGAIATWYFSRDVHGTRSTGSPAFRSFFRALTLSIGSLAFGSLILAVIKFINFMLKIAKSKNKATKNVVMVYVIRCVECIFACLQRLVKFINKFTYIYIAMHGEGFCGSARNVFNLMSRNYFSAAFVDLLGEFVLFVGKLLGTACCTIFTMAIVHGLGRQLTGLTITVVAIVAYIIFTIFAHIIGTGVDTVFVCYLEDKERNKDGNLYISPELHTMLQDKTVDEKH